MSETANIKIGLFGGGGTDKTAISLRYLKGEYTEGYIPTIEDEFSKVVEVDGRTVSLTIIDTCGQDDFAEMRVSYYKQVQGLILVFDISNPQSIDDIRSMYNEAVETIDGEIICAIAASKSYLRDEGEQDLVPVEEYKKLESEFKCKVFETNVKNGANIDELFKYIIKRVLDHDSQSNNQKSSEKKQSTKKDDGGDGGGCCIIE